MYVSRNTFHLLDIFDGGICSLASSHRGWSDCAVRIRPKGFAYIPSVRPSFERARAGDGKGRKGNKGSPAGEQGFKGENRSQAKAQRARKRMKSEGIIKEEDRRTVFIALLLETLWCY